MIYLQELSRVTVNMVILTANSAQLREAMESWGMQLTATPLGAGQKLEFGMAGVPGKEHGMQAFASFTLGRRAGFDVRIHLMGFSLETGVPSRALMEASHGVVLLISPENLGAVNHFLSLPVISKPVVVCGLGGAESQEPSVQERTLVQWIDRSYPQRLWLSGPDKFLSDALEWVLSF